MRGRVSDYWSLSRTKSRGQLTTSRSIRWILRRRAGDWAVLTLVRTRSRILPSRMARHGQSSSIFSLRTLRA
jgi:hypothetical protein